MRKFNLAVLFIVCVFSAVLAACNPGTEQPEPSPELTYQIVGAKDHNISKGETEYGFLDGVYALASNGVVIENVLCDTAALDFTKVGEYVITYSYPGVESIQKKVKVYDVPEITVAAGKESLELDYKDVNDANLLQGISAVDSFGEAAQVALVSGNYQEVDGVRNMFAPDGSPNYGTFETKIFAVDLLGNITHHTRAVVVLRDENTAPQFSQSGEVSVDLIDESVSIEIDLKDEIFETVSLYGIPLPFTVYKIENNKLKIDLFAYTDSPEPGTVILRLVTSGGYAETDLTFVDEKEPQLNFFGLNNWVFANNETANLPKAEKLNLRQKFVLQYELKDSDNNVIDIETDHSFIPDKTGEYTLLTKVVRSDKVVAEELLLLNVLEAEQYNRIYDAANSMQHYGKNIVKPASTTADTTLEYTESGIAENGAYLMTIPSNIGSSEWNHRIELAGNTKHNKDNIREYYKWSIDMYLPQTTSILFWDHADKLIRLTLSDNMTFKNSAGEEIFAIPLNEWFTVEILINAANLPTDAVLLRMGSITKDAKIYFRNIKLITHADVINAPDFSPDFSRLDGWIYKTGTESFLPRVSNLPFAEHVYTFTQTPDGKPLVIEGSQKHTFAETGEYKYTLSVFWKGEKIAERQGLSLNVVEHQSEINVITTDTEQDLSKFSGAGTAITFVPGAVGGQTGVYKINAATDLTSVPSQFALTYYEWTLQMYLTGGAVPTFTSNGNAANMNAGESVIKIKDKDGKSLISFRNSSGQAISVPETEIASKCQDQWITVSIHIGYNANPPASPLKIGISQAGTGIYLKSLKLNDFTDYYYNFYSYGEKNLFLPNRGPDGAGGSTAESGVINLSTRTSGQPWANRFAFVASSVYTSQFSKWRLTIYINNGAWPILYINGNSGAPIPLTSAASADKITIKDMNGEIIPVGNTDMNAYRGQWITIDILIPDDAGSSNESLVIGNNAGYSSVFLKGIELIK